MNVKWIRARKRFAALFAAVTLIASLGVVTVQAVHDTGVFQMDGNAQTSVQSTPPAAEDWDLICKAHPSSCTFASGYSVPAGTTTSTVSAHIADGLDATIFTGGGSKDGHDLPDWKWKNGSVPDKDDLRHAFAARYSIAPTAACPVASGLTTCDLLYFGSDRFDNSGDAQQGFWFFQNPVVLVNGKFEDGSGNPATHRDGDLLIVSDFSNGGGVSTINVYKWLSGALSFVAGGPNQKCDVALISPDPFCGIVNPTSPTVAPWTFTDKSGNSSYLNGELFEAGLNLSDPSINLAGECFASFLAETRSSTSTTATLKDFVFGPLASCGASISISPSAVNAVNDTHTFTVHITKTQGGSTVDAAGVVPTVTLTATNNATIADIDTSDCDAGTDVNGDCDVTFTSTTAGVVTGHASATIVIGTSSFDVQTDGVGSNSGDAVKRYVDAKIAVSPLTATNEVNSAHTITATVSQDDGLPSGAPGDGATGFGSAPDGTLVTFSLSNNTAGAAFVGGFNTCTTTSGTCSVSINTSAAGSVDIHATTTFSVGTKSLTRATGTGGNNSANANKVYVDAKISITPPTATNTVGDPHTFTVTVMKDDGLPAGAPGDGVTGFAVATVGNVDVSLDPGATGAVPVVNTGTSTCDDNQPTGDNLDSSGQCTVVFTSASAGTVTGHATVSLIVGGITLSRNTDGVAPNSGDAVKDFVAGSLKWSKVDNANALQGGATFTVCKTQNWTLPDGPLTDITPACSDIVDDTDGVAGPGPDQDPAAGKFELTGLSLGTYTVKEKTAPAGFDVDPDTESASLTPGFTDKTISSAFVNKRPVLKISGFGYTNVATGTPTSGVVSGTTVFSVNLHNYGNGAAVLSDSSLAVNVAGAGSGTVTCGAIPTATPFSLPITGTVAAAGNLGPITLSCTYSNLDDGAVITATLTIKSLTNTVTRSASGSPATISFTVQAD